MSIINDALKKTEQHIQMNAAKENQLPEKKTTPKIFFLYIIILLMGIFITNFVFTFLNKKIKTSLPPKQIAVPAAQPAIISQAPISQTPALVEEKKPEETFVLNGIFYSGNDGYALINNQIARELDTVDGAEVTEITQSSVELNNQGKIITLTTQR